jgi:adenine-specific DNA-methyltransferase
MMYPRLRLARNLLKEDGVIFMSIDDNEVDNLKKLCNEIFGESNLINQFVWKKNSSGKTVTRQFPKNIEYVLMYAKNERNLKFNVVYKPLSDSTIKMYSKDDNDGRGKYRLYPMQKTGSPGPETTYDYVDNNGVVWKCPEKGWRMVQSKMKKLEDDNRLVLTNQTISEKAYWNERDNDGQVSDTLWDDLDEGNVGTSEIKKIFNEVVFDYPKPTDLINRIIKIGSDNNSIILDFFSGSSTTAHSVIKLNLEDSGSRKFIMVQLPEPTDERSESYKSGYKTITEIGKERIRRIGKKIKEENPLLSGNLDTGFKVFKLDSSNIKGWDGLPDNLENSLFESQDNIKSDRKEDDVLFEILLKYGLDLALPIEEKVIEGKKVFNVGYGALFICLGNDLTSKVAEGIGQWKETLKPETCRVIFKDGGFTDVEKTNSVQTLKRFGIQEIKSI